MQHLTTRVTYKQILITRTTWQDSCQASLAGGKHTHMITPNKNTKRTKQMDQHYRGEGKKHYKALSNSNVLKWIGKSMRMNKSAEKYSSQT